MPLRDALNLATESIFIDWQTFWLRDHTQAEWHFEDVLARGRGHALYAPSGSKKSLFGLWMAVQLAIDEVSVIYLDYEMTEDDLQDRLDDMGHGPGSDLSHLHYALLPELPPLDTKEGAEEIELLLDGTAAQVMVIDTTARAVEGEENSADTIRAFSRHTGLLLRRRGVTWLRLDHTGKDVSKGQRGSKAKDDDPDVVWQLRETENGIMLTARKRRMGWVPEQIAFALCEEPLRFTPIEGDWPQGTADVAHLLDQLAVPLDVSTRAAQKLLRDAGTGRRRDVVVAALRWRKRTGNHSGNYPPLALSEPLQEPPGRIQ